MMPYSVFDTTDSTLGINVKAAGYDAVIKYAESSPNYPNKTFTVAERDHLHGLGVGISLVFETGDTIAHFGDAKQGLLDAQVICQRAKLLGFPGGKGLGLFWAADFDATVDQILGQLRPYAINFRKYVEDQGYLPGAYANGDTLTRLGRNWDGLIHYAWLPQSPGWGGYKACLDSKAWDIHQLMNSPLNLSADGDNALTLDWAYMPG